MGISKLLQAVLPHEDIGWKEIGETFVRYTIVKTPWFRVYLHQLTAELAHPQYHNHPWSFVTIILYGGYFEKTPTTDWMHIKAGRVLYRPHNWTHNVITGPVSWSLVFTGPKKYEWGFVDG